MYRLKNNKGFTLIELLVVIAIIGLLSSMTMYLVNNARIRARDAKRLADIRQIRQAIEFFYDEHLRYPDVSEVYTDGLTECSIPGVGLWCNLERVLNGQDINFGTPGDQSGTNYLEKLPRDPSGDQSVYNYYYDSNFGDNYQSYGLMCVLEHPANLDLAINDGGYYPVSNPALPGYGVNGYEVGSQPIYCMQNYTGVGSDWISSGPVCAGGD